MWQRRAFLKAAGLGFAASLLPRQAMALERSELVFASSVQTNSGGFGAVLLSERGDVISSIDLPDRGHDITISREAGRGVVFARQPGTFAVVFVDRRDGTLVGQLRLDAGLHQLSIRHMAIDMRGRVWFGCQYRGAAGDSPQLVGYATMDGEIRLIELPRDTLLDLRNYIGSVAVSADGSRVAVASPEGDLLVAIDAEGKKPVLVATLRNGCGLAADGTGFVATSGLGAMIGIDGAKREPQSFGFQFDNHMLRV